MEIVLKDCVDLASKLVMFMCYRGDKVLQDGIANSLLKLAQSHPYSLQILKNFLQQYGDVEHKISKTSVRAESKRFEGLAKLLELWSLDIHHLWQYPIYFVQGLSLQST